MAKVAGRAAAPAAQPVALLPAPAAPATQPVALLPAPAASKTRGRRAGKKAGRDASKAGLPDSVVMETSRALSGEDLPVEGPGPAGPRYGVLYRLTVLDAEGQPLASGKYTIRKHLRPAGTSAGERADQTAQILIVPLDEAGAAHDFVGLFGADAVASAAVADVFEYFSFELRGMTCVVPRSGYLLRLRARGGLLQVQRTPVEGDSIHGAVGKGLLGERAGDTYACKMG